MANICPSCLANIDIVGRSHRCIPKSVPPPSGAGGSGSAPSVVPARARSAAVSGAGTYKYRDPDKRRTYMRDYMRRRRSG